MNGSELLLGDQQEMRVRRETLGAQVYHLLRDRILRGEIAGGSRLIQGNRSRRKSGRAASPSGMRLAPEARPGLA